MQKKSKALATIHKGEKAVEELYREKADVFDYGCLADLRTFHDTHPAVMKDFIEKFDWAHLLHYEKGYVPSRPLMKHEKTSYKVLAFIDTAFFGGRNIFGYSNWNIIGEMKS
jgi:hypothetical protein